GLAHNLANLDGAGENGGKGVNGLRAEIFPVPEIRLIIADAVVRNGEERKVFHTIADYNGIPPKSAGFSASWKSGEKSLGNLWENDNATSIMLILTTPSGSSIDRNTTDTGVFVYLGSDHETISVMNPELGEWSVALLGIHTPAEGVLASCQAVIMRGNQPPVAMAGPDQTVECSDDRHTTVTLNASDSFDPDELPLLYQWRTDMGELLSDKPICDIVFPPGIHHVTLDVTDDGGLSSTDSLVISVLDTTPPVISITGDNPLFLECRRDTYVELGAKIVDRVDPAPVLTIEGDSVDVSQEGFYRILYRATDASDNFSTAARSVIVLDTTPPNISCPEDLVFVCDEQTTCVAATRPELLVFLNSVIAADDCDPEPIIGYDAPAYFPIGETSVNFHAMDYRGNTETCSSTVFIFGPVTKDDILDYLLGRRKIHPVLLKSVDKNYDGKVDISDAVNMLLR
ncbi:MAG TPA: DUF5011 domain-containing protein, partial [Candidatus Sumerlaeota bacterium]|nr:DUF5011 domain-containing protein [Candidatus Sumerlaeota bacterium]